MTRDGKHSTPCLMCHRPHYRKGPICRKCEPPAELASRRLRVVDHRPAEVMAAFVGNLPADVLEACVAEYQRRHQVRLDALRAAGLITEAA